MGTFPFQAIAARLGKSPADLLIWDPYYCAGGVAKHLVALGFGRVRNENVDFYALISDRRTVPQHDVVVTNPPYSGDHVERLAAFVVANRKPALVLVPDYFATRSFYAATLGSLQPLCLKPNKQYHYWTPLGGWRAFSLYQSEGRWKRLLTRFEFLAVVIVACVRVGLAGGASSRGKAGHASHRNVALGVRTSPFASAWHVAVSQVS